MKIKWKVVAAAILSLVALVCVGFSAACKSGGESVTYTLEVKYEDGKSVAGVWVVLTDSLGDAEAPLVTDSAGSVMVTKEADQYKAHIENLPAGYTNDEEFSLTKDKTTYTFTLKEALKEPTSGDGTDFNRFEVTTGSYAVTVNSADDEIFYSFYPPERAVYALYSTGDYDTEVQGYFASSAFYLANADLYNDDASADNKNFYVEFETDAETYADNPYYRDTFGIKVKGAASYPAEFVITFKKVGEAAPIVTIPEIKYDGTNLAAYPDASENAELVEAPYTIEAVYNENDGFYHVNAVNGPVLVAAIARGSRYSDASISTMYASGESFAYSVVEDGQQKILNFNSYLSDPIYDESASNITGYGPCLIKSCNSDGVYGVTQDIYTMLQCFVKKNAAWETIAELPASQRWLTFCYYYVDGTAANPYEVKAAGTFEFELSAGQTVYYSVTMLGSYEVSFDETAIVCKNGTTVLRNEDTVKVTLGDRVYPVLSFTAADGGAATLRFTLTEYTGPEGGGTEGDPYLLFSTGTYTAKHVDGVNYKVYVFQAQTAGTYRIVFENGDGVAYKGNMAGFSWETDTTETVTEFQMNDSYQNFAFAVRFADGDAEEGSLTFRIEKVEEE